MGAVIWILLGLTLVAVVGFGVEVELLGHPLDLGDRELLAEVAWVAADVVDAERQTLETLTRNEGKPEQAIEKIVAGRLQGFFKEIALLDQPYAKDDKQSIAQVLGAIAAAWVLYWIASGAPGGYDLANGLANNGYGEHSPHGYSMQAGFAVELVLTLGFLIVILGATDRRAPAGFAPIAIGLCLTLIHLISIPVTNTSVNPARSTGPALLVGDWAMAQLWLFWLAPLIGATIAGVIYRWFDKD